MATVTISAMTRAAFDTAYAACSDGDTLQLIAGTISDWTTPKDLAKAITIAGASYSVDADGRCISSTSILRNSSNTGVMFSWTYVLHAAHRITGIEFNNNGAGHVDLPGVITLQGTNDATTTFRIDHCKFDSLDGVCIAPQCAIGVADHNYFIPAGGNSPFYIFDKEWDGYTFGDGSWAAASAMGSAMKWTIEDNSFVQSAGNFTGMTDGYGGSRFVARFNILVRGQFTVHGTESSTRNRGGRTMEIYCNDITGKDDASFNAIVDTRSGTSYCFLNKMTNYTGGGNPGFNLTADRLFDSFSGWHTADGRSKWDINTGGGPFGSNPFTATGGSAGTAVVSGAGWSTANGGEWKGYSIIKTSALSTHQGASIITGNTSDTISYLGGFNDTMAFANTDTFILHKVDQALDSPGRALGSIIHSDDNITIARGGAGNLTATVTTSISCATLGLQTGDYIGMSGAADAGYTLIPAYNIEAQVTVTGPNTFTYMMASDPGQDVLAGRATVYCVPHSVWNDQVTDPCYEWINTKKTDGAVYYHHTPYMPTIRINEHFFDYTTSFDGTVGVGSGSRASRPATCTAGVAYWSTDQGSWNAGTNAFYTGQGVLDVATATNTWTNAVYTPYTYPHPLTGGVPVLDRPICIQLT